jgi:microcystin-dependent protein
MSEPFIGQLMIFAGNFAPRGWATCDGQILSIAHNTALFSLLGTTYGGNGQTTFALPDLRGRVPMHVGTGPGLSSYVLGEVSGVETVTLINTQMPAHNHTVTNVINAAYGPQSPTDNPSGAVPAGTGGGPTVYNSSSDGTTMNPAMLQTTIGMAGGNQPHENRQPYLVMTFCIALQGIFPSRN